MSSTQGEPPGSLTLARGQADPRATSGTRECPGCELIAFTARVGCRQEEAGSLEWDQVGLKACTVTFISTKTNSPRVIEMTQRSARWMGTFRRPKAGPDRPPFVFLARMGDRLKTLPTGYAKARERAGVPHHRHHDLRHTYAIRRLLADALEKKRTRPRTDDQARGIHALSKHLGRSSVQTTEISLAYLPAGLQV